MEPYSKSLELQYEQPSQMESNGDTKLNLNCSNAKKGWISAIFILGASFGLNISSGAWYTNLIVFLISVFNIKNIPAAQINNIFSGLICFFPLIAAIFADSAFGNYSVTLISSIISLLGVIMFTLLVTLKSMRPPHCALNSTTCIPPTTFQYTFLYIALTLASLGLGGTRFILGTMGADQFDKPQHQATFFNWFICSLYVGWIIAYTLLIYIQTSISWALSFAIALAANLLAALLFVAGSRMYRKIPPQGSPFISIARVFVAAFRNAKNQKSVVDGEDDSYFHESDESKLAYGAPTNTLRFLNKAAMIKRNDDNHELRGTISKSWSQCTVEEVEDVKKLIKIMPLWTSSMLLSGAIGVILSFTVLMALVMDRRVGTSNFKIPAGTFTVITLIVTAITSSMLDRFIYPAYKKVTGRNLTFLQCIGVGHVSNILASIGFALIERRRLELVRAQQLMDQPNAVAPLSALWMAFPLAILGVGEGSFFSPEVAFYYQEYPKSLRSTSTAMVSLHIAAGYYLSSAFIDIVGRTSSWLPNDLNHGRVDYAAWVLAVVAAANFGYFLVCAKFYKYNHRSSPGENVVVPEK
ncbi:protein NRT1/ PTR FAMILY 2.7-like [Silene latifolia]|uniref:protein NRT1/ PTR FAMILY 2.7-like n=1 Tax=Silene latifolia TaxID=37657 RepID=UPI003D779485